MIWFLIGLFLLLGELVIPGLVIIFFGIGAWVAALCCLLFDISLNVQLLLFLVSSLLSLALLRKIIRRRYVNDYHADTTGNMDEDYIGKTAVALEDFDENGRGRVSFRGTSWDAVSQHKIRKGDSLTITGFHSIRLLVIPFVSTQAS